MQIFGARWQLSMRRVGIGRCFFPSPEHGVRGLHRRVPDIALSFDGMFLSCLLIRINVKSTALPER